MMHVVKPPQEANSVIGHMPIVEGEIKQQKPGHNFQRPGKAREPH
jgi:hypothetical protein